MLAVHGARVAVNPMRPTARQLGAGNPASFSPAVALMLTVSDNDVPSQTSLYT